MMPSQFMWIMAVGTVSAISIGNGATLIAAGSWTSRRPESVRS